METLKTEVKVVPMTRKMVTLSLTVHLQVATTCEHQWLADYTAVCTSFGHRVDVILTTTASFLLPLFFTDTA